MKQKFTNRLGWVGILSVFLCLYVLTAPRTHVSYADSDLLTVIGYYLGVGHPPGYPIYIALVYVFTHLPITGSVAFRANVLSAVLGSSALVLTYMTVKELVQVGLAKTNMSKGEKCGQAEWIGWWCTISLGGSFLYWLYSSVAEKYALNNLIIMALWYVMVKMIVSKRNRGLSWWMWFAGLTGLGLGHHQTFLLVLPAVGLAVWYLKKDGIKYWKQAAGGLLVILLVAVGLLVWLNSHKAPVSWQFENSLNGLVRHITRRELSGYLLIQDRYRGIYWQPVSIGEVIEKIPKYIRVLISHFGGLQILILVIGLISLIRLKGVLSRMLLVTTFLTTVFIPLYLDWPDDLSIQAIRTRLYLTGYLMIPLVSSVALAEVVKQLYKYRRKHISLLFGGVMLILSLIQVKDNFAKVNLSHFRAIDEAYRFILEEVPNNSLVGCLSDVSCGALYYSQYIDGLRPDVVVVPHNSFLVHNVLAKQTDLKGFDYSDNPNLFMDYLTWNLEKRPVYVVEWQKVYHDLLGIDYGFFYYLPHGYYGEITKYLPDQIDVEDDGRLSESIAMMNFPVEDQMRQQLKASLAQKHLLNAMMYSRYGVNKIIINRELALATRLNKDLPQIYRDEVTNVAQNLPLGLEEYVRGNPEPSDDEVIKQAELYFHEGKTNLATLGLRNVLWKEPMNLFARKKLAWIYKLSGFNAEAKTEFDNILKYYPDDEETKMWLEQKRKAENQQ